MSFTVILPQQEPFDFDGTYSIDQGCLKLYPADAEQRIVLSPMAWIRIEGQWL